MVQLPPSYIHFLYAGTVQCSVRSSPLTLTPLLIPVFSAAANLPKVSLSPQRRSFGSGCSWKEVSVASTSSAADRPSFLMEDKEEFVPLESSKQQPVSSPPPPSSFPISSPPATRPPRIITHVPLRDQERGRRWRGGEGEGRYTEHKKVGRGV